MTKIKAQAFEILQDIPDDKVGHVIEVLKGLRILYTSHEKSSVNEAKQGEAMGIINKYENADFVLSENEAWEMAAKEKRETLRNLRGSCKDQTMLEPPEIPLEHSLPRRYDLI